jgi:hypothetical protein
VWAAEHDRSGAGAVIARAYARVEPGVADADIKDIRNALERCGAREAAQEAAAGFFAKASEQARASEALQRFIQEWSAAGA